MNKTPQETSNFLGEFREFFQDNSILEDCTVGLACPATNLSTAIKDIEHLNLAPKGVQNWRKRPTNYSPFIRRVHR